MGAVQNSDLARLIGLNVIDDKHVKRITIEAQLFCQPGGALNNKQVEVLRGVQESILIAKLRFNSGGLVARVAGNDAVDKRGAEGIGFMQPLAKGRRQRPLLRIAQHQFPQRFAVVINKLAGNDHPSFVGCAIKAAETFEQQTGQFGRIACRRLIFKLIARVVADARFGGIRKHEANIRVMRKLQKLVIVLINVDFAIDRTDKTRVADGFALLVQAANNGGVKTVLG